MLFMQHKSFRLNPVIKGISLVFCEKGVSYTHVSPCYISLCEKISCDKSWEIQITVLCSMNCCWLLISNFYHFFEIKISDLKECMTLILYHIYCDKILQMLDLCRLYNVYFYFSDGASCASLERVMVFLCRWWPMII